MGIADSMYRLNCMCNPTKPREHICGQQGFVEGDDFCSACYVASLDSPTAGC